MGVQTFVANVLQAATERLLSQDRPCTERQVMQVLHWCISRESERQPEVSLHTIGYIEMLETLYEINRSLPRSSR